MALFESPVGPIKVRHFPDSQNSGQPWDAADHYLIDEAQPKSDNSQVLIVNDLHGALSCALQLTGHTFSTYNDSYCGLKAIAQNLETLTSEKPASEETAADNLFSDLAVASQTRNVNQVWLKIPKSFDQLNYWLWILCQQLPANTPVFLAGMAKHIPIKWLNWLEAHTENYQQFPIKKKARLLRIELPPTIPFKGLWKGFETTDLEKIEGLPGVFSRDHMDIGSRVLLEHLPKDIFGNVTDLGCGNGLLGLTIKKRFPDTSLSLTDDSAVAIESARHNFKQHGLTANFLHTDALANSPSEQDWILCNPPFHSGNQILTDIAERMFEQAKKTLVANGKLLVIANRHLPYGKELKKHFGGFNILHIDRKFTLYLCQKR